jgi:hypothetical protein
MDVGQGPNWGCSAKEKNGKLSLISITLFPLSSNHQSGVYWRPFSLLPSQPVTTTTAIKMRGREIRTAPRAEEARSCILRLRTAEAAEGSPAESDYSVD